MAHLMCTQDIENKKILEIGCGIGLSSLVLNERLADITATDFHPEAKNFLEKNVLLNNKKEIAFHLCNWNDKIDSLGKFDLIIGSDLLYQVEHPKILASFINRHAEEKCEVLIVSPKRGYQNKFTKEMKTFSYSYEKIKPVITDFLKDVYNVHIHKYQK